MVFPYDILEQIATKLHDIKDLFLFGSTSKMCRSIYKDRIPIPLLMLPCKLNQEDDQTQTQTETSIFYSLTEKRFLTNLSVSITADTYCPGSTYGWLAIVSQNYEVHLLNPFLSVNNKIQLPPLKAFQVRSDDGIYNVAYLEKAVLSANPALNSNYIVMAIHGGFSKLAFFKPGNKSWIDVDKQCELIHDIMYCKGKFYVLHDRGNVFACDVDGPCPIVSIVTPNHTVPGKKYLVESCGGDLLQIVRYVEHKVGNNPTDYLTDKFIVFKLDMTENEWIQINSLGGCSLFLGDSYSMSLPVSDFPECKPNCIYFTDDNHHLYYYDDYGIQPHDFGVFNLEDGSIVPLYTMESMFTVPAPIWIQPMLHG